MAEKTVRWAAKQRAGGSGRKAVLMMLAHLSDKGDSAQTSLAELAAACELSADVVRDHLAHLEGVGLIERVACWAEDGGRAPNKIILLRKEPGVHASRAPAFVDGGLGLHSHGGRA